MAGTAKNSKTELSLEEKLAQSLVPEEEWPYRVPDNWCWTRLGTICGEFQYGYTEKATFEKVGPHFIRITDIGDGVIHDELAPFCRISEEQYEKYKINQGDIFIARMGSVGENGLATHDINGVFASYLIRLVPRTSPFCVRLFLQSPLYWSQITDKSQGTTRLNVNANVLKQLVFPFAPVNEQQRIVDHIESLFAKLDEAKEKAEAVVDGYEDRKAAILHKAFTGELTEKWRKENSIRFSSWDKKPFGELASEVRLGLVKGKNEQSLDKEYKYLKMNNITSDGKLNLDEVVTVDATDDEVEIFNLKEGDFLFNTRNSYELVGKNTVWRYSDNSVMLFNNNIMRVRFKENIYSVFVSYYLNSLDGKLALDRVKKNTTNIAAIYAKDLNKIAIPIPSYDEQKKICDILDSLLEDVRISVSFAESALEQIDFMKRSILARAFRGELGTNDPSDESAEELLKQILQES